MKGFSDYTREFNFFLKRGFKQVPISQTFLYLEENKQHFLNVRPFFIKDSINHRNQLKNSCQKTRFKTITNAQKHRFGPSLRTADAFPVVASLPPKIASANPTGKTISVTSNLFSQSRFSI